MGNPPRALPIVALKGGTGKTTTCAGIGLALRDMGYRVGFMDVDVTGPTLPRALGIPEPFPQVGLDTVREKMLAVRYDGYEVFSLAFRFGDNPLIWKGGEQQVKVRGRETPLSGTGRYSLVKQMLANVEFSELDYLLLDLPPSSGDETIALFDHLTNLWGAILVCQPTSLTVEGIRRTLKFITEKHVPLLGLIGNMVYAVAPKSGERFIPFLDAGIDLAEFCRKEGIPYLAGVPFTPDRKLHQAIFRDLAGQIVSAKPLRTWEKSFKAKVEGALMKTVVKGLFANAGSKRVLGPKPS